jgi:hypothetical protein
VTLKSRGMINFNFAVSPRFPTTDRMLQSKLHGGGGSLTNTGFAGGGVSPVDKPLRPSFLSDEGRNLILTTRTEVTMDGSSDKFLHKPGPAQQMRPHRKGKDRALPRSISIDKAIAVIQIISGKPRKAIEEFLRRELAAQSKLVKKIRERPTSPAA